MITIQEVAQQLRKAEDEMRLWREMYDEWSKQERDIQELKAKEITGYLG
jgi:hypothetical protein